LASSTHNMIIRHYFHGFHVHVHFILSLGTGSRKSANDDRSDMAVVCSNLSADL
jgi:hypothetical protein